LDQQLKGGDIISIIPHIGGGDGGLALTSAPTPFLSMILNSLFPVFVIIVLGHILKRYGLTNDSFLSNSDRLIYFIFSPHTVAGFNI
jgi:hypothetical protein